MEYLEILVVAELFDVSNPDNDRLDCFFFNIDIFHIIWLVSKAN